MRETMTPGEPSVGTAVRLRGWAGPPPLLILATVLAFLLVPVLDSGGSSGGSPAQASLAGAEVAGPPDLLEGLPPLGAPPPRRRGRVLEPRHLVGVASFNEYNQLSTGQAVTDARFLTSRPGVDVIGWQEAGQRREVFADLRGRGWDTRRFPKSATDLAVSWRRADFRFVSAAARLVAYGVDQVSGRYPFPDKWIVRVTLRHRASGRLLSVLNTHLPHKIEDRDRPGRWTHTNNAARARFQLERMRREWERAPGRWVVGTGDYNFDARSDARTAMRRAPAKALGDLAASSYQVLGLRGMVPTHPPTGRYIDYVHASRPALDAGTLRFVRHWVITSLNSDHHALVAQLALR